MTATKTMRRMALGVTEVLAVVGKRSRAVSVACKAGIVMWRFLCDGACVFPSK